jgi:hypothetical protein
LSIASIITIGFAMRAWLIARTGADGTVLPQPFGEPPTSEEGSASPSDDYYKCAAVIGLFWAVLAWPFKLKRRRMRFSDIS